MNNTKTKIKQKIILTAVGVITAVSIQLNWASEYILNLQNDSSFLTVLIIRLILSAISFPLIFFYTSRLLRNAIERSPISFEAKERYKKYETFTYAIFIVFCLGAFGLVFNSFLTAIIIGIFIILQLTLILTPVENQKKIRTEYKSINKLYFIFFISGFSALIYQVVWQRVLFSTFGVNIESVTIIVSIFMFGLGIGSLLGGYLSQKFRSKLLIVFSITEISIGVFGITSLQLIHFANSLTVESSLTITSAAVFLLLLFPTLFMGATLPLLVTYINHYYKNVGKTVGLLYFANTLGSSIACFATAYVLFVLLGLQTVVYIAVFGNLIAGAAAYLIFSPLKKKQNKFHESKKYYIATEET